MARPTIAIDIDDVLSLNAAGLSSFSNKRWGLSTTPDAYTEAWAEFWGVPLERAVEMANEFHASGAVYYYDHIKKSLPVLRKLKTKYSLIVVTSRRKSIKDHTDKWLSERFPGIFDAIHYAGIWDVNEITEYKLKQTKAELCRELGASYLIDDQAKHCVAAQEAGIQALLFGDYTWNRCEEIPENVVRVKSWQEVQRYFDAQS